MNETFYVVRYTGPFGFIKPWTAVRDGETHSQQFLTPSIIEGMRQKLGVESILRHKLSHCGFSRQQEVTQSSGVKSNGQRARSIITRGVMLRPRLHLAFISETDASRAHSQHLCLCRNEDVVCADGPIKQMTLTSFEELPGFELRFGEGKGAFLVGYNRFEDGAPMYGRLETTGNPTQAEAFS